MFSFLFSSYLISLSSHLFSFTAPSQSSSAPSSGSPFIVIFVPSSITSSLFPLLVLLFNVCMTLLPWPSFLFFFSAIFKPSSYTHPITIFSFLHFFLYYFVTFSPFVSFFNFCMMYVSLVVLFSLAATFKSSLSSYLLAHTLGFHHPRTLLSSLSHSSPPPFYSQSPHELSITHGLHSSICPSHLFFLFFSYTSLSTSFSLPTKYSSISILTHPRSPFHSQSPH